MVLFIIDNVDGDITKGKTMDIAKLTQLVEDVIVDFTNEERIFSAYDVTKKLRACGHDVRHFEVKGVVHGLYTNFEMDNQMIRTGIRLNSGRWTLVYHMNWQDVANYDPNDVAEVAKDTQVTTIDDGTSGQDRDSYSDTQDRDNYDMDDEDENDDGVTNLTKDNRRRVCIPANSLRSIGANVGDVVYALPTTDLVVISKTDTSDAHPYIVDKDNNVRLGNLVLNKAGLGSVDEVECSVPCDDVIHVGP